MSSGEEFADYLASVARAEAEEAVIREKLLRHELWQKNTILGRLSVSVLKLKEYAFFQSVADAFRDQQHGESLNAIILFNVARILLIIMAIVTVFVFGKVIQKIIGDEIIVEQVVEIVHEVPKDSLPKKRRGAKKKISKDE